MIALVDCNNFFVSCERLFQPELQGKPVVVLSNNDGCIVSRSTEAKRLGIPMAGAFYKVRDIAAHHGVLWRSSNFSLYGDMSARVMCVLASFVAELEIYSVDEAFLRFPSVSGDGEEVGRCIKERVEQWTGIPVSVGFAPNKTLAKIATDRAKKDPGAGGVFSLMHRTEEEQNGVLAQVPVGDIWGIGPRMGPFLLQQGIQTARDLKEAPEWLVRRHLTVQGARLVRELRGDVCFPLTHVATKKSIAATRSFRRGVTSFSEMREAVATYVGRAARRLRLQDCYASQVTVFIRTNPFRTGVPQYHRSTTVTLAVPSGSTARLLAGALRALEEIFVPGYAYQKAGVILTGLLPMRVWQRTLWGEGEAEQERDDQLMVALDRINRKWGEGTLVLAAQGIRQPWSMRQDCRSPRYTTAWQELLSVKIT